MILDKIIKVIMNNNEKCDVNNYRSNYRANKKHVSIKNDNQCKYHVIYSINKNNIPSLRYSNTNQNGLFLNYLNLYFQIN
jgi:hypothetical protein